MKTVVTHNAPDLDAITSVWLVKTFLPDWEEASVAFVPAGKTYKDAPVDSDADIMHVDTGFGKFDHHQTNDFTCASKIIYEHIASEHGENEALARMVAYVTDVDHFQEVFYPDPAADMWDFSIVSVIDGWRLMYPEDDLKIMHLGMDCLDALYKVFQNKIWAEKALEEGIEFESEWGKALGLETINDSAVRLAQRRGYVLVVRKDPKKGYLRIKTIPKPEIDLEPYYQELKDAEPDATWFLHASHHMLLNGSTKNPDMRPSRRPLAEIIEVLRKKST